MLSNMRDYTAKGAKDGNRIVDFPAFAYNSAKSIQQNSNDSPCAIFPLERGKPLVHLMPVCIRGSQPK